MTQEPSDSQPLVMHRTCGRCGINDTDTLEQGLLLECISGPAGDDMLPGNTVTAKMRVTNMGQSTVTVNMSQITRLDGTGTSPVDSTSGWPDNTSCVAPGQGFEFDFHIVVTTEDHVSGVIARNIRVFGKALIDHTDGWSRYYGEFSSNQVTVSTEVDDVTAVADSRLSITKFESSTPINGRYYYENNWVHYGIIVSNNSNEPLTNIEVYDSLASGSGPIETIQSLAAGDYYPISYVYTVDELDVHYGQCTNVVSAYAQAADGTTVHAVSNPVTVKCGPEQQDDSNAPYIIKELVNEPENGTGFCEGEAILFRLTIVNPTDRAYSDFQVEDSLPMDHFVQQLPTLAANDSTYIEVAHTVTAYDIAKGYVENAASMSFTDDAGNSYSDFSNSVRVPCAAAAYSGLRVTKKEISTPQYADYYMPNEPVVYQIVVTNTGNFQYGDIVMLDNLAPDSDNLGHADSLNPGESCSFTFTYIPNEMDIGMGFVSNQAAVMATRPDSGTDFAVSNIVRTRLSELAEFPEDSDEELPPIDPRADLCSLSLITAADGTFAYAVSNCEEHSPIDADTRKAVFSAKDDAALQKAYEDGTAKWMDAIEELYNLFLSKITRAEVRTAIVTERAMFDAYCKTLAALLLEQYPDEPAVRAELLYNTVREKASDLCWLAHSERGALSDTASQEAAPLSRDGLCRRNLITEKDGYSLYSLDFCHEHQQPAGISHDIISDLFAGKASALDAAQMRSTWASLLNSITATRYEQAPKAIQDAILADNITYGNYVEAYAAVIDAFYKDHSYADEILTRTMMLRTVELCGNTEKKVFVSKAMASVDIPEGGKTPRFNDLFGANKFKAHKEDRPQGTIIAIAAGAAALILIGGAVTAVLVIKKKKKLSQ